VHNCVVIVRTSSEDPALVPLIAALDAELRTMYGQAQDTYDGMNKLPADCAVVIAKADRLAIACGAYRPINSERAEVKRMFVAPDHRGRGHSRSVLAELERWAKERGFSELVLETGTLQAAAIALYQNAGYARIPNFGAYENMPLSLCFAKNLGTV
jgi:putative acetyltransferase